MVQVLPGAYSSAGYLLAAAAPNRPSAPPGGSAGAAEVGSADPRPTTVTISSLAGRLSKAADSFNSAISNLSHRELGEKVRGTIETLNYPLTAESIAAKSKEVPEPGDAAALASAAAANEYVANLKGRNPFAGLSREQLSHIANDESGAFTTNERYAAYRQAYDEEEAWRSEVVAHAMDEYKRTGKLTNFFSSLLAHFNGLPAAEQSLYPESYASDLQSKVDLDFNYFTSEAGGRPDAGAISLASLRSMAQFDD